MLRSIKGVIGGRRMPTMLSLTFGAPGVSYTGSVNGEIFQWATHKLVRIVEVRQRRHRFGPLLAHSLSPRATLHAPWWPYCTVLAANADRVPIGACNPIDILTDPCTFMSSGPQGPYLFDDLSLG